MAASRNRVGARGNRVLLAEDLSSTRRLKAALVLTRAFMQPGLVSGVNGYSGGALVLVMIYSHSQFLQ